MVARRHVADALLAGLGVVACMVLAGCGKAGAPEATAMPANMTMATSAATAALPDGSAQPPAYGTPASQPGRMAQATAAQPQFAQVVAVQPLTQSETSRSPHRVCRNEQVAVPETYRDNHQIGGAVVGGLVGGLLGHQIGGGRGRTLATVAGAAGGAFAGHEIQKSHQQDNQSNMQTRYVCHTVTDTTRSTRNVGYDVTYIWYGHAEHVRMDHDPGVGVGLPIRNGVVLGGQATARAQPAGSYYR